MWYGWLDGCISLFKVITKEVKMNEERKSYTIELFLDNGHGCGGSVQKYVGRKAFEEMLRDAYELLQQYKGMVGWLHL